MNYCETKHSCADGKRGECRHLRDHLGQHLCSQCLTFFTVEAAGRPEPVRNAPAGAQALFLAAQQAGAATGAGPARPAAVRPAPPVQAGPFQIFGIWKSAVTTPYGTLYTELILQPDKKFSRNAVLNHMMTYDVGTVELGDGYIHFVVKDHEPKMYNGTPMRWVESWTYFYTVVDANTITVEDRLANTHWNMQRG